MMKEHTLITRVLCRMAPNMPNVMASSAVKNTNKLVQQTRMTLHISITSDHGSFVYIRQLMES